MDAMTYTMVTLASKILSSSTEKNIYNLKYKADEFQKKYMEFKRSEIQNL